MPVAPYATAIEIARAYREGTATCRQVTESLLDRIDRLDRRLGSFQAVYADDARTAADAADMAIRSGHTVGPFHGIPFALKDIVDVEGRVTTGGSHTMRERISPVTASVARRLIAAGGIMLGKTKTVELAMGGWGTNQHMGTPLNPWDLDTPRTPGGSSSGSGVAVAAGLVPCAVGTDTGGSVRSPAAWCGIVGLKVTAGILPIDGIIPLSQTLDTPGPMTRSAADAAFMFDVMAGADARALDRHLQADGWLADTLAPGISGLRIGALDGPDREGIEDGILELYDAALDRLRSLGAEIVPFVSPVPYSKMAETNFLIFIAEGYAHHGALMEDRGAQVDEDVRARFLAGRDIPSHVYIRKLLKRDRHIAAFHSAMRGYAALVSPTMATAPVPVAAVDQTQNPARFTRPVNYLATCAATVPMGLTAAGLPGGLQVMARGGDEQTALRIAAAFEADRGPFGPPALPG